MVEFTLPDLGEGVAEGEVVLWLVGPGETVEEDQPLVEVETDKALVEIPSPVAGRIVELRAEPGEVVPVGEVIVVIDEAGSTGDVGAGDGEPAAEAEGGPAGAAEGPDRVFAPPRVRRLARELGVDLGALEGSGEAGRLTEADVRAAAGGDGSGAEAAGEPAAGEPRRDRTLATPATRRLARELGVDLDAVPAVEEREDGAYVTEAAVRSFAAGPPDAEAASVPTEREERVPYRGVRRTVGSRMVESATSVPHVTHHDAVDVSALVEARESLHERAEAEDVRLTYLPFVLKAVVAGLEAYPALNASLDEEAGEIVLKHHYDIGVAVATEAGLMVPVVEAVDDKGLFELAAEVDHLAERARDRRIDREEMRGGTFSITNFGAIGGEYATPLINLPEVAILGLGSIEPRPWVADGEVVARETLPLSLSIDHRVVDGAVAARFINLVKEPLASPALFLLD